MSVELSRAYMDSEATDEWVRNPDWLPMPTIVTGDYKFAGLFAVYDTDSSFVALLARGAYTVDWGDGSAPENVADNVQAQHQYDYDDTDLDGTEVGVSDAVACTFTDTGDWVNLTDHGWLDGQRVTLSVITSTTGISINKRYFVKSPPIGCTFTDAGDLVTSAGHGFVNDERIRFYSITTTTGITKAITYYIVNKTTDDFQVSLTQGGAAVALTTNGSGSFYPADKFQLADTIGGSAKALTTDGSGSVFEPLYRQAMITVVPQGAGSTFTTINLDKRHSSASAVAMSSPWLDVNVCGSYLTTITIRGSTQETRSMEQCTIIDHALTTFASMFSNCISLASVQISSLGAAANTQSMFSGCALLRTAPEFGPNSVTNAISMFSGCSGLKSVHALDLSSVTNASNLFQNCAALLYVPMLNLLACNNFTNIFQNCASLHIVPAIDFSSAVNTTTMFSGADAVGKIEGPMPAVSFSVANLNLGPAALDEIYTNLPTATATITVTGNYGTSGDDPTIATAKNWTVVD